MKKIKLLTTLLFATFCLNAATIIISGNITTNTSWINTNLYILLGEVYVKNGATLTIQEGTIIEGDKNSTRPCLIITKGAKINAIGTPANPIVFTSNQSPGSRNPGDWGGVVILGKAPNNDPSGIKSVEGLPASTDTDFGGTDPADNSGVMKYVRIEFGGIAFAPNQEINGLTLGSVGNGTVLENIQVSYSGDDAFEWFGGTVKCKNLISYHNLDDDFDTDYGYSGKVQFGVCLRHPNLADVSGSNGFESDNDAGGTFNNPRTSVVFSNMTLIGPKATLAASVNSNFKRGEHTRRSSISSIFNSIIMGWPIGLYLDGNNCENAAMNDSFQFISNVIAGCNIPLIASSAGAIDSLIGMETFFTTKALGSMRYVNANDTVKLTNPFDTASFNPLPLLTSAMLSGSSFTSAKLNGFENVNYRGAFGTTNWMDSWSSFTPKTNVYKEKTAGIKNNILSHIEISMYPNPATTYVNIVANVNSGGKINIQINDLIGRVFIQEKHDVIIGQNNFVIPTSQLTPGIYVVNASDENGISTQTIKIK